VVPTSQGRALPWNRKEPQGSWADHGDTWRERLASSFAGLTAVPHLGDVAGSIASSRLGEVSVFEVRGNAQVVRRTPSSARHQPLELLKVCLQVDGRAVVEQRGVQVALAPGQLALYDTSRPYRIHLAGSWRCDVMTFPRTALGIPERLLNDAMRRPHGATDGVGRLLAGYLRECNAGLSQAVGDTSSRVGEAGVALLAGTLLAEPAPAIEADAEQVRRRIVDHVRARIRDPRLSPASVAAAHHMSLRTVQRLFEGEQQGLAGLIREQRLEAVRRDLADPLLARSSIAAIAARSCVTNQQWLSHAFRCRFGLSPSEYRIRQAMAGPG